MNPLSLIVNATRRLEGMFPGYFAEAKHNHYRDFGYPDNVTFDLAYQMYSRNGIARAAVDKTIGKTWQDNPWLMEREDSDGETTLEAEIRQKFDDLRLWQKLEEADRRSMVGDYAGVILRFADNKLFNQPVDAVPGGLDGLVEVIPAWQGQLWVSEWDTDERSETYGQPTMFQFNEASVDPNRYQQRSFSLHPDRVIVWSRDGTVHNRSMLEPGYNDLLTLEKVSGAGGEGFWKNAKSAPVLQTDKDVDLKEMARSMGVPIDELADKMDSQVDDWQKGFDKLLMLQGMEAKTLGVTLPLPGEFFNIALQSFASSIGIPLKILVGSQTGERASTEDANEWAQTCMARRMGQTIPNIMATVNRLERVNVLPERDWHLDWTDLTETSIQDKTARANQMADVNQKMMMGGEIVFTADEIREAVGLEPLTDDQRFREDLDPASLPPRRGAQDA